MTVLVLKTLSDLGCGNSRCNEELHFSVGETFFKEENNPRGSSLSQKFSFFFVLLSSDGGKIFYFITCIIFDFDDENKVDQSLIFFFVPAFCRAE